MSVDVKRLLMEFERALRDTNKAIINPEIEVLKVADLEPILAMVARARAAYLKSLLALANACPNNLPNEEQIAELKNSRVIYDELLSASKALQVAIERGYLDVGTTPRID